MTTKTDITQHITNKLEPLGFNGDVKAVYDYFTLEDAETREFVMHHTSFEIIANHFKHLQQEQPGLRLRAFGVFTSDTAVGDPVRA